MATEQKPSASTGADFLKDLPSFKKENFTRFVADSSSRSMNPSASRPDARSISADDSTSQVIVTEKTSILLRYLHAHWDKHQNNRKRIIRGGSEDTESSAMTQGDESNSAASSQNGQPARKMPRTL